MDIDNIFKEIIRMAGMAFGEYKSEVEYLVEDFYEKSKEDIKSYSKDLTLGKITRDEYEFLLKGKKDLLQLAILEAVVESKMKAKKLQDDILNFVIDKLFLLLP